MATKKITFDPEAGVAYPCDLIMNVGADLVQLSMLLIQRTQDLIFLPLTLLVLEQLLVGQDHLR